MYGQEVSDQAVVCPGQSYTCRFEFVSVYRTQKSEGDPMDCLWDTGGGVFGRVPLCSGIGFVFGL